MTQLKPEHRQTLELLLAGRTAKQVAAELGLCRNAVDQRIHNLKQSVGVRTLLQLGAWAERHGIKEAQS